ncbi:hypothetical protein EUTSA_v10023793mg [Eutrema salsugineum]|uniref:Uncharacterized protein n=1 Tax=Eutrema salsugineum TaxID=72664 RepID=V4JW42_EUTSA|nr:hypothetical protein EUTSA_v10023793mg [Eutrema salsugineum]
MNLQVTIQTLTKMLLEMMTIIKRVVHRLFSQSFLLRLVHVLFDFTVCNSLSRAKQESFQENGKQLPRI